MIFLTIPVMLGIYYFKFFAIVVVAACTPLFLLFLFCWLNLKKYILYYLITVQTIQEYLLILLHTALAIKFYIRYLHWDLL